MGSFKKAIFYVWPERQLVRRSLSMAIAVFFAFFVDHFYSQLHEFWVPMMTVIIIYMTVHVNLRQVLERVFVLFLAVLGASWLFKAMNAPVLMNVIVVSVFAVGYGLHSAYLAKGNTISMPLLIAIVFLILLTPFSTAALNARMHDVVLGSMVGVAGGLLVFPGRPDVDFRQGVVTVLQAYNEYLQTIIHLLFRLPDAEEQAKNKKIRVEQVLQVQQEFFPEWVYEPGFSPTLQQGHRHFLIRVEQLGQILFAMHQVARHPMDAEFLAEFREPIERFAAQTTRLMNLYVDRLNLQKIENPLASYDDEVVILEGTYRKRIQVPLELLDTSPDYIDLAAFIYYLKDMQKIMLKMAEALR